MTSKYAAIAMAALLTLLAAGCGGGDASRGSVRDDVQEYLLQNEVDDNDFDEATAGRVADCFATTMFDGDTFTKDERNDAARAVDGDAPDPDLVERVEDLLADCIDQLEVGVG